jgi:hypothetical protein
MSNTVLVDLLNKKEGKPCNICSEIHLPKFQCRHQALVSKIVKLMEANSMIPSILHANKEATTLASGFQHLLKKADEAHSILMSVLDSHGEEGFKIKEEYLERLNKWAEKDRTDQKDQEPTNPDTSEQLSLFNHEHLTPEESKTKSSTGLSSGGNSLSSS